MRLVCEKCGMRYDVENYVEGTPYQCNCGSLLSVEQPKMSKKFKNMPERKTSEVQKVVVERIDLSFGNVMKLSIQFFVAGFIISLVVGLIFLLVISLFAIKERNSISETAMDVGLGNDSSVNASSYK